MTRQNGLRLGALLVAMSSIVSMSAVVYGCRTLGVILTPPADTPTEEPTAAPTKPRPVVTSTPMPSAAPSPTDAPVPRWTPDPNWTPAPVSEARGGFGCGGDNPCRFTRVGTKTCVMTGDSTLWQWMKTCNHPSSSDRWHCDIVNEDTVCLDTRRACNGRPNDDPRGFDISVYKGRIGDEIVRQKNAYGFSVCVDTPMGQSRVVTLEICLRDDAYTCKDPRAIWDKNTFCERLPLRTKDGSRACTYPSLRFPAMTATPVPTQTPRPRPVVRPRQKLSIHFSRPVFTYGDASEIPGEVETGAEVQ